VENLHILLFLCAQPVEKAVAIAPVHLANDVRCTVDFSKTPKSAHAATDPAGECVHHDGASEVRRKLNKKIEDHPTTMALRDQSE
jgi:hypothetical protein